MVRKIKRSRAKWNKNIRYQVVVVIFDNETGRN